MNLSQVIGSLPSTTLTVTRRWAGAWTNGLYSGGDTTSLSVDAIVYPATKRELERLPEGLRTKESIGILTATDLRTATEGGVQADRVSWGGSIFEVAAVEPYQSQVGFCHSVAVRV